MEYNGTLSRCGRNMADLPECLLYEGPCVRTCILPWLCFSPTYECGRAAVYAWGPPHGDHGAVNTSSLWWTARQPKIIPKARKSCTFYIRYNCTFHVCLIGYFSYTNMTSEPCGALIMMDLCTLLDFKISTPIHCLEHPFTKALKIQDILKITLLVIVWKKKVIYT